MSHELHLSIIIFDTIWFSILELLPTEQLRRKLRTPFLYLRTLGFVSHLLVLFSHHSSMISRHISLRYSLRMVYHLIIEKMTWSGNGMEVEIGVANPLAGSNVTVIDWGKCRWDDPTTQRKGSDEFDMEICENQNMIPREVPLFQFKIVDWSHVDMKFFWCDGADLQCGGTRVCL